MTAAPTEAHEPQPAASRRGFLSAAAALGAASLVGACSSSSEPAPATCPVTDTSPADVPPGPLDVVGSEMPQRQDDPAWGQDLMWDRGLVIQAATELEGMSQADAESLLREFEDGNDIANEGCMLTCLAMALRLLGDPADPPWTPRTLNEAAQESMYYTLSGLSMTTLYADLVSEVSEGAVQLFVKEEYLPGVPGWARMFVHTSPLVRAYRSLSPEQRGNFLVMLKTGTYDDTVASHYVLLHPDDPGAPDADDPWLLDPAMPPDATGPWRLTDSAAWVTQDPEIAAGWEESQIQPTQIGGAWVLARSGAGVDKTVLRPLVRAWALELAREG